MKINSPMQLCSIFLLLLIVAGCQIKRPDDVLSDAKMENVLYDYHLAKAIGENMPTNENYQKALYIQAVFKKHGTTEAAFDSSLVWYTRNTQQLAKIYEKVNKRLKLEQEGINHLIALRDKKTKITAPGDSIDVWNAVRVAQLTGMPLNNTLTFVLLTDSNYHPKDTLVWQVRYRFLDQATDSTQSAVMAMQIRYKNDSIISGTKRIVRSGMEQIRLHSDTLGAIKEVQGFIYYSPGTTSKTVLADRIALMRYHSTDTLSAHNDSLRTDSIKADSLKRAATQEALKVDTVKQEVAPQRLSPEEMNRRRSNSPPRTRSREPLRPQGADKPVTTRPTTTRR